MSDESGEAWVCVSENERPEALETPTVNPDDTAGVSTEPEVNPDVGEASSGEDSVSVASLMPSGFSIQLAAFRSAERRDRYVESLPLEEDSLILTESEQDGQHWLLVLYGDYPDLSEASAVQDRLRQDFGINDSWIRPAASAPRTDVPDAGINPQKAEPGLLPVSEPVS